VVAAGVANAWNRRRCTSAPSAVRLGVATRTVSSRDRLVDATTMASGMSVSVRASPAKSGCDQTAVERDWVGSGHSTESCQCT
jgi:hypothetical protein